MTTSAASGFIDCWLRLGQLLDGAWMRAEDDVVVGASGLPIATLNGVWVTAATPSRAQINALLDEVRDAGLPHCLQLPIDAPTELVDAALARGMVRDDDIPLMEHSNPSAVADASADLTFRRLSGSETSRHALVAAQAFGAPPAIFDALAAALVPDPAASVVVGRVGQDDVTTGLAMTIHDRTGVFNVATLPRYRRRGLGAAITAWLVADGFARGGHQAWLQSSSSGLGVYEGLGFRTVAVWQCWTTA
jgi:N-acetylglutamate synthase